MPETPSPWGRRAEDGGTSGHERVGAVQASMSSAATVGSLRHACAGCGGSCQGVRVRLVSAQEEERIVGFGAALGVDTPVQDGRLRFEAGRCVFLDRAGCRIHARWGGAAKPAICRQYPLVVVDTGTELRAGVDPGCYSAWKTRAEGPLLELEGAHALTVPLDAANTRQEAALLAILGAPGMTLAGALTTILGSRTGPDRLPDGLPPGFAGRWISRLQASDLGGLLARGETGAAVRGALGPVIATVGALDPAAPPPFALAPEQDAWAVEVARRLAALRLVSSVPMVQMTALLALGGAVVCAWSDPAPDAFGSSLAGWARALRAPIWWQAIVPDPGTLQRLAGGGR